MQEKEAVAAIYLHHVMSALVVAAIDVDSVAPILHGQRVRDNFRVYSWETEHGANNRPRRVIVWAVPDPVPVVYFLTVKKV